MPAVITRARGPNMLTFSHNTTGFLLTGPPRILLFEFRRIIQKSLVGMQNAYIFVLRNLPQVNYVGNVVSVRVPPDIKREMDELRGEINWSEEIREFIKKKIKDYRKRKALQEIVSYIQTLPEAPKGTAQKLVREDRDSH